MDNKSLMTCPNEKCSCNKEAEGRWFIRKGSFIKLSGNLVHRFQCKACGVNFSESTFMDTYRQHKPELNEQIFNWYTNSVSLRQLAINLPTTRTTVARKFRFLADKARRIHACFIATGKLNTNQVAFDEQETFIRTKKLPVSIAIAVDATRDKTGGRIIDIDVALMPAKSRNAPQSQELYGYQPDERPYVCRTVLNNVRLACRYKYITIATDAKTAYRTYVRQVLPNAIHIAVNRSEEKREQVSKDDEHPMWWVNQCCAANRHYLSRLRRRTCVTSKSLDELRRHLWLFVAQRNGYAADLFNPLFDLTVFRNIQQTVIAITDDLRQGLERIEA